MTEIPKEALDRMVDLAMQERNEYSLNTGAHHYRDAGARYIADVSEKASLIRSQVNGISPEMLEKLKSLILPNPEDDLLKEAREICARDAEEEGMPVTAGDYRRGYFDGSKAMRCTLAALRKGN